MAFLNSENEYGKAAKVLHWLVFLLLVGLSVAGLIFAEMERGETRTALMRLHASTGVLALAFMAVRLGVRFGGVPAPLDPSDTTLNRVAAVTHGLLYAVIFALIGAGMMTIFTAGAAVPFYGLFEIASPWVRDGEAHEFWEETHETLWWVLVVLVGVHIVGAVYHHVVKRDDTMARMK